MTIQFSTDLERMDNHDVQTPPMDESIEPPSTEGVAHSFIDWQMPVGVVSPSVQAHMDRIRSLLTGLQTDMVILTEQITSLEQSYLVQGTKLLIFTSIIHSSSLIFWIHF